LQENDIFNSRFALHVKADHLVSVELLLSKFCGDGFILWFAVSDSSGGTKGSSGPLAAVPEAGGRARGRKGRGGKQESSAVVSVLTFTWTRDFSILYVYCNNEIYRKELKKDSKHIPLWPSVSWVFRFASLLQQIRSSAPQRAAVRTRSGRRISLVFGFLVPYVPKPEEG